MPTYSNKKEEVTRKKKLITSSVYIYQKILSHQVQIFQSRSNAFHHFLTFRVAMRARIQRGVETGADFSYAALQLFSLEKCDEHRFKYLIALKQSAKLIQQEIKSNVFTKKKKKKAGEENFVVKIYSKNGGNRAIPFRLILIYISIDRPDIRLKV